MSPEIAKRCDPERNVLFAHVYGGEVKVYRAECNEKRAAAMDAKRWWFKSPLITGRALLYFPLYSPPSLFLYIAFGVVLAGLLVHQPTTAVSTYTGTENGVGGLS